MSLLLPTLSGVKENARRAQCASNVRQICISMNLYANENDGQLPGNYSYLDYSSGEWSCFLGNPTWPHPFEVLSNYLGSTSVLYCPSWLNTALYSRDSGDATLMPNSIQPWGKLIQSVSHYGFQMCMDASMPGDTVLVTENAFPGYQYGFYPVPPPSPSAAYYFISGTGDITIGNVYAPGAGQRITNGPHNRRGSNIGYIDSHVEWRNGPLIGPFNPIDAANTKSVDYSGAPFSGPQVWLFRPTS